MDTSTVISVAALAVSIASAWYSCVQAQLKRKEHERQAHVLLVNVDKSVSNDVHTGLRITNSGHSPVYLKSVTLRQRELSWNTDWLAKELQPNGGSHIVYVYTKQFVVEPGVEVDLAWTTDRMATGSYVKHLKRVL